MRSAIGALVLLGLVSVPSTAAAALITTGTWSDVSNPSQVGTPFWTLLSSCPTLTTQCNAAQVILGADGGLVFDKFDPAHGALQYLHASNNDAVEFSFATPVEGVWKAQYSNTALTDGKPGQLANGAVTYTIPGADPNDPALFFVDSLSNPLQFALFRQVNETHIRYFFAFEDRAGDGSDYDYNDLIMSLTERRTVPEPATLALLGTAMLGLGVRRLRRRS